MFYDSVSYAMSPGSDIQKMPHSSLPLIISFLDLSSHDICLNDGLPAAFDSWPDDDLLQETLRYEDFTICNGFSVFGFWLNIPDHFIESSIEVTLIILSTNRLIVSSSIALLILLPRFSDMMIAFILCIRL